eukprot:c46453_g1_i1.p1 GENE.c46453_g1_i1~~c46453_g1_i1.p1  ORF type:complete len:303 (+),score=37.64 c46453_g1_i1:91-999(+)
MSSSSVPDDDSDRTHESKNEIEKVTMRRERNKELARKSRQKKKVELEQLHHKVSSLTFENGRLHEQVRTLQSVLFNLHQKHGTTPDLPLDCPQAISQLGTVTTQIASGQKPTITYNSSPSSQSPQPNISSLSSASVSSEEQTSDERDIDIAAQVLTELLAANSPGKRSSISSDSLSSKKPRLSPASMSAIAPYDSKQVPTLALTPSCLSIKPHVHTLLPSSQTGGIHLNLDQNGSSPLIGSAFGQLTIINASSQVRDAGSQAGEGTQCGAIIARKSFETEPPIHSQQPKSSTGSADATLNRE